MKLSMFQIIKYDYPLYWDDSDNVVILKPVSFSSEEYSKCFIEWAIPNPDFKLYRVQCPGVYGRFIIWRMQRKAHNSRGLMTTYIKSTMQQWSEDLHANFDNRKRAHNCVSNIMELFPLSGEDVIFVFNQFQEIRNTDKNFCPLYAFSTSTISL